MARIKILLTEDVLDLGLAGEVHTVAGGYARNYLIPRGLAILATKGAMKQAEEIKQAGLRRRAQERINAEAQKEIIEGKRILFQARAGENDRLYGSVTTNDIAERLSEEVGFEIDRRRISPSQALRDLGIYSLQVRLMHEVNADFTVGVVRENEGWADAEARAAIPTSIENAEAVETVDIDAETSEIPEVEGVEVDEATAEAEPA